MKKNINSETKRERMGKPGKTRGPIQREAKEVMAELVVKLSQKLDSQPKRARIGERQQRGRVECWRSSP